MLKNYMNPKRLVVFAAAIAAFAPALSHGSAHAAGAERSLAGISIFAPGTEVTHKFGNPSRILVGGAGPAAGAAGAGGTPGGFPGASGGFPGASGGFPGAPGGFPGGGGEIGTLPGFGGGFPGASGGFPGASGGFPGAPGGFPGAPGSATAAPVKQPVTLVYDRQKGGTLEFTISPDKRVVQIRETGYVGTYGTARGIKLGMPYSAILARYGYPENTTVTGSIINIDYKDTLHCGFQFLDQRLVAIIVASPD